MLKYGFQSKFRIIMIKIVTSDSGAGLMAHGILSVS